MTIKAILLVVLLAIAPASFAQFPETVQTIEELQSCSVAGDPECQAWLGEAHWIGFEVARDVNEAERLADRKYKPPYLTSARVSQLRI